MAIRAYRTGYLSNFYRQLLLRIAAGTDRGLKLLDLGCGSMELTERIADINRDVIATIAGMDIYAPGAGTAHAVEYLRWDGSHIPVADNSLDVVIASDLIHHVYPAREQIFGEAARVARWLIVKDHFEYGRVSRAILRGFDLLGNWRNTLYGANVCPARYFDRQSFATLCAETGYAVVSLDVGHNVYGDSFRLVFPPDYQFIALLDRSDGA